MAPSSDIHYHGGRHGRRTSQLPVTQNLKFYKGARPSSPSVDQGTAVQPVRRSGRGRPAVHGRPGMAPALLNPGYRKMHSIQTIFRCFRARIPPQIWIQIPQSARYSLLKPSSAFCIFSCYHPSSLGRLVLECILLVRH